MADLKYLIILIILIISLIVSIILSFIPLEQACGGINNGCYVVNTSQYETIFGIKNSHIGIVVFLTLITFTLCKLFLNKKLLLNEYIINFGIFITFLFSIYFFYIQIFVLKLICKYCMVIDIGAIINFGILLLWKENDK